jgi:hypothetical protein
MTRGGGDGCLCATVTAGDNCWAAGGGVAYSREAEAIQGIGIGVDAWQLWRLVDVS